MGRKKKIPNGTHRRQLSLVETTKEYPAVLSQKSSIAAFETHQVRDRHGFMTICGFEGLSVFYPHGEHHRRKRFASLRITKFDCQATLHRVGVPYAVHACGDLMGMILTVEVVPWV